MRVRNKPWAKEKVLAHPEFVVENPTAYKGKWQERFSKNQPLHIEVGSRKRTIYCRDGETKSLNQLCCGRN